MNQVLLFIYAGQKADAISKVPIVSIIHRRTLRVNITYTMYFVYLVLLVEMCSWWYIIRYSKIYISNQCRSNRAVSCMSGLVNFRGCPFSKLVWTYRDHIVLDRGQMHCFHYRYESYFLVQTDEIIIIAFNSAIDNVILAIINFTKCLFDYYWLLFLDHFPAQKCVVIA